MIITLWIIWKSWNQKIWENMEPRLDTAFNQAMGYFVECLLVKTKN